MKNRMAVLMAALILVLLSGCGGSAAQEVIATEPVVQETTAETLPPIPADGTPGDVTCKGTYTGEPDMDAVVARCGEAELTNEVLQAWYWGAVASHDPVRSAAPDFSAPLDSQPCPMDGVNSWQQYFLKQALNNWHTAQAMVSQSRVQTLPVEEAFTPHEKWREENMADVPAVKYLYREEKTFQPNTMHQAYLDNIPKMLEKLAAEEGYATGEDLAANAFGTNADALEEMVALYNYGYFFHTNQSYFLDDSQEEVESWFLENESEYEKLGIGQQSGRYVDFRQILLVPQESEDHPGLTVQVSEEGKVTCDEVLWEECLSKADDLIRKWNRNGRPRSEGAFSDLANKNSMDAGTAADGGAYRRVEKGQMIGPIDAWCFDETRKPNDHTVIRTEYGVHILYFSGAAEIWEVCAREDLLASKQRQFIQEVREQHPMTVTYSDITLKEARGGVTMEQLLYGDVAHERFPEIPLYLQQDYGRTMYGGFMLRTNGCGVTSYAMVASYMMDEEMTPPEMCARYGMYSKEDGTDVTLMMYEPPAMGFYNRFADSEEEALEALKAGHIIISIQTPGYWTRGGHYIVVEKMNEDGTVQVRDSNIFNYGKLEGHKQDKHTWESITKSNKKMWIIDKKLTRVPICSRCGDGQSEFLETEYLCHKCRPALLRRGTYLSAFG